VRARARACARACVCVCMCVYSMLLLVLLLCCECMDCGHRFRALTEAVGKSLHPSAHWLLVHESYCCNPELTTHLLSVHDAQVTTCTKCRKNINAFFIFAAAFRARCSFMGPSAVAKARDAMRATGLASVVGMFNAGTNEHTFIDKWILSDSVSA
jgi:hypothetical protein